MKTNLGITDIHYHILGGGLDIRNTDNDVFYYDDDNQKFVTKVLYLILKRYLTNLGADIGSGMRISTDEYLELTYNLLKSSKYLNSLVLLALDAVYFEESGKINEKETDLFVSNKFLYNKIVAMNEKLRPETKDKQFLFGASVNPNREDWETELKYVINETDAVLLKLIPSTQKIRITAKKHEKFFKMLAEANLPLLCHVGPEYSFPEGVENSTRLDKYKFLAFPLKCGVKVIAAHCATPVFPIIDRDDTDCFIKFIKKINKKEVRLYGDLSAFAMATRAFVFDRVLNKINHEWLIQGSDFPIPIEDWGFYPILNSKITWKEYEKIRETENPLDKDIEIKRALGFSESVFTNASKVLRIKR